MKTEFIPKTITLLAGAVVCIICIIKDTETVYSLKLLLATLIVFYIIGCIARRIIEYVKESNRVMKLEEMAAQSEIVQDDTDMQDDEMSSDESENNKL